MADIAGSRPAGENRRKPGPGRHAGLWRERRRIRPRSSGEGRQRWRNLGRWRQGRRLRPEAHSHRQRRDPGGLQPVDQPLGEDSSSVPSATCNNGLVCNAVLPRSRIRHPGTGGATTDLRRLPEDGDGCWRRPHPLIQETYDKKLQSLQELLSKQTTDCENLAAAGTDARQYPRRHRGAARRA